MTCQMYARLAGRPLTERETLILDLLSRGNTVRAGFQHGYLLLDAPVARVAS